MPFHSFAILASSVASGALNVLGHLAEAASAKGTSAKPASKKNKTPSDPASQANVFAAYLATVAASLSAVPPPAASTAKPSAQKGSPKSITASAAPLLLAPTNPERRPPGLPLTSIPTSAASLPIAQSSATPAGAKNGVVPAAKATQPEIAQRLSIDLGAKNSLPPTATVTSKIPTAPTATVRAAATAPPVSARVPVHATPDSIQAARASAAAKAPSAATAKSSASATQDVPAKPLSQEGKDEIHLGTHTAVEAPLPEIASPDHAMQTTANDRVLEYSDPSAPKPSQAIEVSSVAGAKGDPVAAAPTHPAAAAPGDERFSAPSAPPAANGVVPRLFTASAPNATLAKASVEPAARLFDAPAPAQHGESPPQTATAPSPAPGTPLTATLPAPAVAAASQPSPAVAPTAVPVAEQLTRAFVAQAEVVQRAGQTNFHLRLDPPQLGSVQIHLTATEHTVSARIVVAQEGTRQLLESTAQHLRQGLADAGLSLGSFDVTRDGGGSRGGGQQTPPQTPWSPPTFVSTPRASTVVPTTVSRPTDGINILA